MARKQREEKEKKLNEKKEKQKESDQKKFADKATGKSMKERLNMYQNDVANEDTRLQKNISTVKQERAGYSGADLTEEEKAYNAVLLEERIEMQKNKVGGRNKLVFTDENDVNNDNDNDDDSQKKSDGIIKRSETLYDKIKASTRSDAVNIMQEAGLYDGVSEFNMNNKNVIGRLVNSNQLIFRPMIAQAILDGGMEKVYMCNCKVDAVLLKEIVPVFVNDEERHKFKVKDLWLESNPLDDECIMYLIELIDANLESLETIKAWANKKDVTTPMVKKLLASLDKNEYICKFVFEFRLQQEKDKIDKIMRRNQDFRRKRRTKKKLEEKKKKEMELQQVQND